MAPDESQGLLSEAVLKRLRPPCEAQFSELVEIYEEAFPESERKSTSKLRVMLEHPRYHFLVFESGGRALGFAIARELPGASCALFEYMAVRPEARGRGLGKQMVAAVLLAMEAPPNALLLEVESDRATGADQLLRARRKRFYLDLGAREIEGLHWLMPPQTATPPPPMEMLVMGSEEKCVPKARIEAWLRAIYVEVYGKQSDDRRLTEMISGLPEEVRLV